MLTLIAARARNGAIGKAGTIPWDVPEDMRLFMRETTGGALIMGRKTWESLPKRPLPNRLNIVVTSHPCEAEVVVPDIDAALRAAAGHSRVYGAGGQGIYEALLPHAHRLLLTEVGVDVPGADAFFPAFDPAEFHAPLDRVLREDGPRCVLREYLRR